MYSSCYHKYSLLSFQNTVTATTGPPDFHKIVTTVLKTVFEKWILKKNDL